MHFAYFFYLFDILFSLQYPEVQDDLLFHFWSVRGTEASTCYLMEGLDNIC